MAGTNKLSARQVETLRKNKTVGKHFDGGGLYLQITEAGGCYWRYKYRLGKKEKLFAIGTLEDFGLAEAREAHGNARKLVLAGNDPVEARTKDKVEKEVARAAARSFRDLAQEWRDDMIPADRAETTAATIDRSIKRLNAQFGGKAITDVTVSDLTEVLKALQHKGQYATRERVQGVAMRIGGFCVGRGYLKVNPFREATYAEAYTSAASQEEARPAITDPDAFGAMLRHIDQSSERQLNKHALRLLNLIAVRPGELVKARWEHISVTDAKMIVPAVVLKQRTQRKKKKDPRAGQAFEVPLSRQALAELEALRRVTGGSEYLFPTVRVTGEKQPKFPHMQRSTINDALERLDYTGTHCSHGFRSAFSTIMNAARIEISGRKTLLWPEQKALIEVQLDHNDASTQAIYDRGGRWEERAELMQLWADKIDDMRHGVQPRLRLVA